MTLHAVKQNIIEYGKKFADIDFSLGDTPRILVQQNHRVFGTEPGADFADLQVKEICDITGTSDSAKGALIASPYEAMVVAKTEYTAMCIRDGLSRIRRIGMKNLWTASGNCWRTVINLRWPVSALAVRCTDW